MTALEGRSTLALARPADHFAQEACTARKAFKGLDPVLDAVGDVDHPVRAERDAVHGIAESFLLDIADQCQDFERRVVVMVNKWRERASASDTTTVQYPTDFDTRSLQADIDEALSLKRLSLSPEVDLALLQQIVARKFGNMDPGEQRVLIDSLKVAQDDRLQKAADIANGKGGGPVVPGAAEPGDAAGEDVSANGGKPKLPAKAAA